MGDKRIPISESNRDALKGRKRGDDTYDDVIERLLDGDGDPGGDVDTGALADAVAERLEGSKPLEDMAFEDWFEPDYAQTIALLVVDELEDVNIEWDEPEPRQQDVTLEASERRAIAQEVAEVLGR